MIFNEEPTEISVFNISQIESLPVTSSQLCTSTKNDLILSKVLMFTQSGWPNEIMDIYKPYWNRRQELSV